MDNRLIPPLWCDEFPESLRKEVEENGPAAALFVLNPSAVPGTKRRKLEKRKGK